MKKGLIIKIIVGILLLILNSCDIPGTLIIRNQTKGVVKFRSYNSISNTIDTLSINEITISNKEGENQHFIFFGFGQFWTDEKIKQYITDIKRIDILTSNDSITVEGEQNLYEFFKKKRKGIFKNEIRITIKDN